MNLPIFPSFYGKNHIQEHVERPNGILEYQWLQSTKGRGIVKINGEKIFIDKGNALFLMSNQGHSYYGVDSEEWQTDYICFNGKACSEILNSLGFNESSVYSLSEDFHFGDYIDRLDENNQFEDSKILYDFLLEISKNVKRILSNIDLDENKKLQIIVNYIDDNFSQQISIEELAQLVNLTKEYLCTFFKKHMGMTISHYIQNNRIAKAKMYLKRFPDKKVKEISVLCGFESASYFCMVFKKFVGITPEEFRYS